MLHYLFLIFNFAKIVVSHAICVVIFLIVAGANVLMLNMF